MPRTRQRTTNRANWTQLQLENAERLCRVQGTSIRRAAKLTGIPFSTLQERIKKQRCSVGPKLGRNAVFTAEQEISMADHLKFMAKIFYGLTPKQLRRAAFDFADSNKIAHPFNKDLKLAGKDWLYNFLRRNPTVSKRKPENTSLNRVVAFNREEIDLFFKNLEDLMMKHKFTPSRIYNVDETGISNVEEPEIILAEKGQKRCGAISSAERGKLVTVICAMSATGNFVPPMFIFPRQRMSALLTKDGPPDSIYANSKNGWSNEELFLKWLHHFSKFVKPKRDDPILLILDNHGSHISLEIFEFCKEQGIIMLSIPPHTSHRLQPLDVTFYGTLKKHFRAESSLFLKSKALSKITHYDLAAIFNRAYSSSATVAKGVSGFSSTGIYPMNHSVFSEDDFIASDLLSESNTSKENLPAVVSLDQQNEEIEEDEDNIAAGNENLCNIMDQSVECQDPGPSKTSSTKSVQDVEEIGKKCNVSFSDVFPIPGHSKTKSLKPNNRQHSTVLTSTPLKEQLLDKMRKKKAKEDKNLKNKTSKKKTTKQNANKKTQVKTTKSKRRKRENNTSESESNTSDEPEIPYGDTDDEIDDNTMSEVLDNDNETCMICDEHGKNEVWYRCVSCGSWAHKACSGATSPKNYKCDFCISVDKVKSRKLPF